MEYRATPVVEIQNSVTKTAGIQLLVKAEYLNHPFISGNKFWKLKYNLEEAKAQGFQRLLTFGGAFSNHIYATAAGAREFGLGSIGIIRGEKVENDTLKFAQECGMQLHFISRDKYRLKNNPQVLNELEDQFGNFYCIPEGGTNMLAVKGCAEFAADHLSAIAFDHLLLPVGTGGTMAGIICGFRGQKNIHGVAVLKGAEFLEKDVNELTQSFSGISYGNWRMLTSYHHGGYAKVSGELNRFIVSMKDEHNLPLDHVYTAKMMWAIFEEIKGGNFSRGSVILALHTGGLQGSVMTQA